MCRICGFVNYYNKELLQSMVAMLDHRGPDDEGYFISPQVSLGHRRLSIIDLSNKGKQPMFNEDKSVVIIFNFELWYRIYFKWINHLNQFDELNMNLSENKSSVNILIIAGKIT